MSVLIKGMDMPKNCESCRFRRCISDLIMFSWVGCQLDVGITKKESFKGRNPDCPLVEVKVPHGDLIDRDTLIEGRVSNDNVRICAENAPTIIEAEGKDDG